MPLVKQVMLRLTDGLRIEVLDYQSSPSVLGSGILPQDTRARKCIVNIEVALDELLSIILTFT